MQTCGCFFKPSARKSIAGFSTKLPVGLFGLIKITNLVLSGDATGLSGIVVSDPNGSALEFSYYEGSDDGGTGGDDGGTDITDGCDLPSNNFYLLDNESVLYNSADAIGGFQFNVDGASATGASGGDAAAAGFTVQAAGTTVLGFSFTGGTISSMGYNFKKPLKSKIIRVG